MTKNRKAPVKGSPHPLNTYTMWYFLVISNYFKHEMDNHVYS